MELIINLYQERASHALTELQKAMQEYKATQDIEWLMLSFEWQAQAYRYLELAEEALEYI